jgi:hypothetical protein
MFSPRLVAKCVTSIAAVAVAFVCTGAIANATPLAPQNETGACVNLSNQFCRTASPQVVGNGPNCTPFPDGNYWETKNDLLGHPIAWTYANGATPCVRVNFTARALSSACTFWLYVPQGNATATFTLGWTDSNGGRHTTEPVNENATFGWSELTMNPGGNRGAANVTSLFFQDNNGQHFPAELGWGTNNGFGLKQSC